MLLRIVAILFPMFAITALGFWVGRRSRPDLSHANQLNMDVFVPALVFAAMVSKDFRLTEYLPLAGAAAFMMVGSGVVGWLAAKALGMQPKTLVPPMMFNNCGNLGLPLAVLAFGETALAPAVVMFLVSNLLHFSFGAWLLDHRTRLLTLWRSPVILATLAGLAVGVYDNLAETAHGWHVESKFVPSMDPAQRQQLLHGWKRAVDAVLYWARED